MEELKKSEYSHLSVFVYPPDGFPEKRSFPHGLAEIELLDSGGWVDCRVDYLSGFIEKHPEFEVVAFLCKESTGQRFRIGRISIDDKGCGVLSRAFGSSGLKVEKSDDEKAYKLILVATLNSGMTDQTISTVLLEGSFKIPFEIRDDRVVGFKKEAKVEESVKRRGYEGNPLFKKVEPFQPAIPNTVWWQIGMLPMNENSYINYEYCPRKKHSKAVF